MCTLIILKTCGDHQTNGYYPPLDYPDVGYGFDFGPGIYPGGFVGGLGWGGCGWGPNWFNCSIFENAYFFNHYGFRGFGGRGFRGHGTWAHNPEHRLRVAHPNQGLRTDSTATLGTAVVSVQASHNVAANSEAAGSKQHRLPERQASRIASEV
jgi:hypothetical protein